MKVLLTFHLERYSPKVPCTKFHILSLQINTNLFPVGWAAFSTKAFNAVLNTSTVNFVNTYLDAKRSTWGIKPSPI